MAGFQSVTAVTISGAFVFGMLLVLLESLRGLLAKRLNLSEQRVDWLLAGVNASLIPMMLVSGLGCDHLGVKNIFLLGSLVTALAVFCLALSETPSKAVGAILLAGVGGACLSTSSSVLMSKAFFPDNEPASQNLGNVFFGLGALVAPALWTGLLKRLDFRRALGALAICCLVPALIALFANPQDLNTDGAPSDLTALLNDPILWLAGLLLLLYTPLEGSIGTWGNRYLTDLGIRSRWAAWLLGGFWLMFLGARLLTGLLQEHGSLPSSDAAAWWILILALAAAVVLGNMAGARTRTSGALGLLLVGACFGPIFPTLVGLLFLHFPHARGSAFGAMFAIGAVGNFLLPSLMGAYARRTTVRRAMNMPMIGALLLALITMVFGFCLPLFSHT